MIEIERTIALDGKPVTTRSRNPLSRLLSCRGVLKNCFRKKIIPCIIEQFCQRESIRVDTELVPGRGIPANFDIKRIIRRLRIAPVDRGGSRQTVHRKHGCRTGSWCRRRRRGLRYRCPADYNNAQRRDPEMMHDCLPCRQSRRRSQNALRC